MARTRELTKHPAPCLRHLLPLALFSLFITGVFACSPRTSIPGGEAEATPAPLVVIDATAGLASQETAASNTPVAGIFDSTPIPTATPEPTANISLTTGRGLPMERRFQPVMAVIDNAPQARPQTGLLMADIIYEFSLDRTDHSTRLVALFSDNDPVRVGPITSARFGHFDLRREWNAMLVFNGYPSDASYPVYDAEAIEIPAGYASGTQQYFVTDRTVTNDPDLTLFCSLTEMKDALYGLSSASPTAGRFTFQRDATNSNGKPFTKVGIPFTSSNYASAEFVYNPVDNRLYRYEQNSKGALAATKTLTPGEDGTALSSEPLYVQNLIVQYVKYTDIPRSPYRNVELVSNGKCDFFVNGLHSAGQWVRESLDGPTVYSTRDGNPLALEPGTTWIVLHTLQREVRVHYS